MRLNSEQQKAWDLFIDSIGYRNKYEKSAKEYVDYYLSKRDLDVLFILRLDIEAGEKVTKEVLDYHFRHNPIEFTLQDISKILSDNQKHIASLKNLLGVYNPTRYSLEKSKKVIINTLNYQIKNWDKNDIPLIYATKIIPPKTTLYDLRCFPEDIKTKLRRSESIDMEVYGHLDFINALLDLVKEKIIKIKSFQILHIDGDSIVFETIVEYNNENTDKYLGINEKIKIFISPQDGVYKIVGNEKIKYPIKRSSKRARLIYALKDGQKDAKILLDLLGHNNLILLTKEIGEINKNFRNKLNLREDIIKHLDTGGYILNEDFFNVEFL